MKQYGGILVLLTGVMAPISPRCVAAQDVNFDAVSARLVERMQLRVGEKVLLVGIPGPFDDLVDGVLRRVAATGAEFLGGIAVSGRAPPSWRTVFTQAAEGKSRAELTSHFEVVDVAVMLPGASPTDPAYAAMQDVLRAGQSRTVHFHWSGAYDLNGNLLRNTPIIDVLYARAVLNTDYAALADMQERFEEAMRGNAIRVTTPEGTDVSFHISDRPVTRQDGDASARRAREARNLIDREIELPAGAIRVAPLEESVRGTIVFPDAQWNGVDVTGLTVHLREGRIVEITAETGLEAVEAELGDNEGARSFREFALGFNPLMPVQAMGADSWIPYYGYGAGVVRLSLGDNTELGGNVTGGYVRWNFFPNATVIVGSEVWVREGRLLPNSD